MDKDVVRRRLVAALVAVEAGKTLYDFLSTDDGASKNTMLSQAFNDAVTYLDDEYFDPEGLAMAQRALAALNAHCFSLRKGAVAKAVLETFLVRQSNCRRKARRDS
jgi:hypothetical protein